MNKLLLSAALATVLSGCLDHAQTGAGKVDATKQKATLPLAISESEPATTLSANHELGRRIYNFRCYYCHGYSGDARTLAATFLDPKPLNFTQTSPDKLDRDRMLKSIYSGRPNTAMQGFANTLKPDEIAAVADFVRQEFMITKAENTRYHTAENGWPDHERYAAAFPFATGEIPLDTPWEQLDAQQADGKRFFLTSCVSCHDRSHVSNDRAQWESRPLSYPRNQHNPGDYPPAFIPGAEHQSVDGTTSASPYRLHDRPPSLSRLTAAERLGETLYQQNCAFCHAADGTARNWIGSFMEPHPRDLTSPDAMYGMTRERLRTVIQEGLPDTSMPAWKSVLTDQEIEAIIAYVGRAFHPLPHPAQASAKDSKATP